MKYAFFIFLAGIISLAGTRSDAQGMAINATGAPASSSAMLDVSSTTQGVLVPRMTSAQRTIISSPATGLLVYQTDGTAGFYFFNGTAWTSLSGGGSGGAPTGSAGGALTGTYPNPTLGNSVVATANINATGTPSASTYLRGDGSWGTPAGSGNLGGTVVIFDGSSDATYTITDLTNRFVGVDLQRTSTVPNITIQLPSPSSYPQGTIINIPVFNTNQTTYTYPNITVSQTGSTFIDVTGSYTNSDLQFNSVGFKIMSDGVLTWYVYYY